LPELPKAEKAIFIWKSPFTKVAGLERLDVFSLPALGPLRDFELHRLAPLQAFETARLDRRAVDKNIFAILAADKAVAFASLTALLFLVLPC